MNLSIGQKTLAVASLAMVFALGGCSLEQYQTEDINTNQTASVETLLEGDYLEELPDGLHKITFNKEATGEEADTVCLVIKDSDYLGYKGYGFVGIDCNPGNSL
jgi:hypothetical protein